MSRIEQIGDCTLYLGDCREILPTLTNQSVDMIFSDPPYGHNNNDGDLIANREKALGLKLFPNSQSNPPASRPILNDGPEADDLAYFMFNEAPRLLASGGCCCCCCGGGGPDPMFARWSLAIDKPLEFKQMVIWDKGPMGMGWHYRRSYETVLVAQKRGGACKWYDESNAIENIVRPGAYGVRKIIPQADDHPTPKPSELAGFFMRLHTREGEAVLDPFMGGGSTGEACVQLGRKFIGIELDPEHFDASCRRIENFVQKPDLFRARAKPKQEAMLL